LLRRNIIFHGLRRFEFLFASTLTPFQFRYLYRLEPNTVLDSAAPLLWALDPVRLVTSRPKFAAARPQLSHTSMSIRSLRTRNRNGLLLQRGHAMGCSLLLAKLAMFDPFWGMICID
jgi:hypothetical protein